MLIPKPCEQRRAAHFESTLLNCVVLGFVLAVLIDPRAARGDSPDAGVPFVRHFPPREIGDGPQVTAGVEGSDGALYFRTNRSVLEYDGVGWRHARVPTARRLALDDNGRVWVGCDADLGYLESEGPELRFVSLRESLPKADRPTERVQSTVTSGDVVWFVYTRQIIRWSTAGVEIWRAEDGEEFEAAAARDGQLYIFQQGRGLLRWPREAGMSGRGAEVDGKVSTVMSVPTMGEEKVFLLGTDSGKIHSWRDGELGTFSPEAERLLDSAPVRQVAWLRGSDGDEPRIAVASHGAGLLVLSGEGSVDLHLTAATGLPGDGIYSIVEDGQGSLWLGTVSGISRLSGAPITFYTHTPESPKSLVSVVRYQGTLYIGSIEGAYRLEASAGPAPARFLPVAGDVAEVRSWAATPQGLLTGTLNGLFEVRVDRAEKLADKGEALAWSDDDGVALAAGGDLLRLLVPESTGWRFIEYPGFLPERITGIHPEGPGAYWLLTPGSRKLYRLTFPAGIERDPRLRSFESLAPWPRPIQVDGRLGIRDGFEVFFWDSSGSGQRVADPRFALADWVPPGKDRYELRATAGGGIWLTMRDRAWQLEKSPDGTFRPGSHAVAFASRLNFDTHADPDRPDVLWLATDLGPARFDTRFSTPSGVTPRIRFLPPEAETTPARAVDGRPVLPHSAEAVRFEVAAPYYLAESLTEYRFRLAGLSETWSTWTDDPVKEFTNLSGDDYRFEVQARNAGRLLGDAELAFRVLPPWHQTWWFRVLVALGLASLLGFYARTQRRKLERQRVIAEHERSLSRRLKAVDKLKDEFLANTSHELRTPLHGITGLAESLIDGAAGEVSEAMKANLSMIVASGRRLGHLVGDILDFSKLRYKSLELNRRPVDLHALVDVVLTLSASLLGAKDLRLENAIPPDLPAAFADENRLQQILYNLIGNAIKFTEEGVVEVSASVAGEQLMVRVRDTGIGIAPEKQEQIFGAFEQADASVEREYGGTGLGLAVTRQLVELHGGSIGVESTPGEGSTFFFSLKVAEGPAEVAAPSAIAAPSTFVKMPPAASAVPSPVNEPAVPSRGRAAVRILAVDDEPINRQVLVNQLVAEGYRVDQAASGPEALRQIDEQPPDLVLLDVMMPRMSGYEVCRTLRERFSLDQLPVLFLTAKSQPADLVVGLTAGANDYLPKPISKSELLARVETHLALRAVHRELSELVAERTTQVEERERLLQERQRLVGKLEAKNGELIHFNYTISHDLKNPLTTIKNYLGLARRDVAKGETGRLKQDLDLLQKAADKLYLLLEELYEFSKVGLQANPPEEVAFEELALAALAALDGVVAERGAVVEVAAELPTVRGDRPRLEELLRHLIQNALQYSDPSRTPSIEIGARPAEDAPVFYVRDNGLGIDPSYHQKIFDLFDRLDPEASEGTGIGLALAKRIAEVHGGRIWVESEGRGLGSTFCVTLLEAPDLPR